MTERAIDIIIPAYNEEAAIAGVVEGIRQAMGAGSYGITVVDDGSLDRTAACAREAGAEVVSHPYRMGNGASIKTGLRRSTAGIVVLLDGDGQHDPAAIPQLVGQCARYDMAIGARNFKAHGARDWANRIYSLFASYVTRFPIKDLTSGFRAMKREAAAKFLYLLPNGFSSPTTLTMAFLKTGRPVIYVPVPTRPRSKGRSKINLYADGMKFLLIITKIAVFFSPFRIFFPVSVLFFASGLGYYLYTFVQYHRFTNMSALLFTTSVIIFMLGLVSEQISQLRMERAEG